MNTKTHLSTEIRFHIVLVFQGQLVNLSEHSMGVPPDLLKSDPALCEALKILRLLHLKDLRGMQDEINNTIETVQAITANPKTDTRDRIHHLTFSLPVPTSILLPHIHAVRWARPKFATGQNLEVCYLHSLKKYLFVSGLI
jgi:hypothetical protein